MRAKPEGTKRINKGGYVEVKIVGKRRWAREHRLVWEEFNGPIPKGAIIHHINHNKSDNRLENLECVASNAIHLAEHHGDQMREVGRKSGLQRKGHKFSEEHKTKISIALTRYERTPEHQAKITEKLTIFNKSRAKK